MCSRAKAPPHLRRSEAGDTCPEEMISRTNFKEREEIPLRTRKESHFKHVEKHVYNEVRVA